MKKQAPSFRNLYFPCSDWPGSWAPLSVAPGASQASWIPPWGPPLAHPKSSKIFVSIVGATIFLEFSQSVGVDTGEIFGYKNICKVWFLDIKKHSLARKHLSWGILFPHISPKGCAFWRFCLRRCPFGASSCMIFRYLDLLFLRGAQRAKKFKLFPWFSNKI